MGYEGREDIFFIIYGPSYFYISYYICAYTCIHDLHVNIKNVCAQPLANFFHLVSMKLNFNVVNLICMICVHEKTLF